MNFKCIFLFVFLFGAIGCTNFDSLVRSNQVQNQGRTIYNQGKTYIRLEKVQSTKGASEAFLDHPKFLDKDLLSSALASIHYKDKGITGFGKEHNIFQKSELLNLAPHIADALTKASPSQYILVNSNYNMGKSLFKSEVYTVFGLFIANNRLNVVFSRIQYEDLVDKGKDNIFGEVVDEVFVDPFTITKNPFWIISPSDGQTFRSGHENWLIIDLTEETFVKKEDYGKKVTLTDKPEAANSTGTGGSNSNGTTQVILPRMSIKDQLLELKELEATGLITKKDYELRKALILGQKQEKSIKDKFNELRKLKEDGFISDIDYDHKKSDLLEEHDDDAEKRNIKEILSEYLELRDEGFITEEDYDYKKKKLLKEF